MLWMRKIPTALIRIFTQTSRNIPRTKMNQELCKLDLNMHNAEKKMRREMVLWEVHIESHCPDSSYTQVRARFEQRTRSGWGWMRRFFHGDVTKTKKPPALQQAAFRSAAAQAALQIRR